MGWEIGIRDRAGRSVEWSADGGTAIIGAHRNDSKGNDSGHARIYTWNDTDAGWMQQGADIDGEAASDEFGYSVALSADGGTAIKPRPAHAPVSVSTKPGSARLKTLRTLLNPSQGTT